MQLVHTAYEPAGDGPHPMLIAFHGWGANALDLLGLAPYVADGHFTVACPQGPMEVEIGPTRGYGWYQIRMGGPPNPEAIEAAARDAAKFVDSVIARYPVNKRKVVLLGFSQGGTIAYRLAMATPDRFAALVGISTWFPPELKDAVKDREALERLPTLIQHGRADDMIEIGRARTSVENLREMKVPLTYREYDCGHEITADGLADLSTFLTDKVLQPIVTV